MPKVQVLIPCYNYGRYLDLCVRSVTQQDGVDVNVLIIDDCSSDNTQEVGERLAASDPRIRYRRHAVNRGHIGTFNEGISLLTEGDYFVLLSADDLLAPGALGRSVALMEHDRSVGLVYGAPITLYGERSRPARLSDGGWTIWEGRDWIERTCRSGLNFIVCPEAVIRLELQQRLGGYNQELPHSADMEMWLRAASIANVGHIDGADQAYYRVHDASMQRTVHAGFLFDLKGRRDAFLSAFAREAAALPGAPELLAMARRSLALAALDHAARALDGPATGESIEDYYAFAAALDPAVAALPAWQALERRSGNQRGLRAELTAPARRATRMLRDRAAWRKWHATGIY